MILSNRVHIQRMMQPHTRITPITQIDVTPHSPISDSPITRTIRRIKPAQIIEPDLRNSPASQNPSRLRIQIPQQTKPKTTIRQRMQLLLHSLQRPTSSRPPSPNLIPL